MMTIRPSSALVWLLAVTFAGCVICWGWSYVGAIYVDRGRLLVIDGQQSEVLTTIFNLIAEVRGQKDAEDYLAKPKAWYALRKAAMTDPSGPTFTDYRTGFGFGSAKASDPLAPPIRLYAIPLWTFAVSSGVPLAIVVAIRARQKRRRATGQCANCGYDLRGSPDRCPECGTVPKSSPGSSTS